MKRITYTLLLLVAVALISACAVKKSKKKQGPISKLYHNTTAKFNGYFNANVLVEESIKSLEEQHQDNYTKILHVYKYVANDNPQAVAGNLDEAMKKVAVVSNLHDRSNWVDDCYLILGKAQYLKKDYESAEETLLYMSQEFSPEAMAKKDKDRKKADKKRKSKSKKANKKKRKKAQKEKKKKRKQYEKERKRKKKEREKERKRRKKAKKSGKKIDGPKKEDKKSAAPSDPPPKTSKELEEEAAKKKEEEEKAKAEEPDNYFLKHKPAYQEGLLWLAKTLIERESFNDAERLINQLESNPKTFKEVRRELAPLKAHFELKQKNYDEAIPSLEEAIELAKKRKEKARYSYIIAQIHQQKGREEQAVAFYENAYKMSSAYDMKFSSRLNVIQTGWKSGKTTKETASKQLKKMLKDIKNEDYRDQIYYALANIALEENDRLAAINYLRSSLFYSTKNPAQKAESYLQLANLYFEAEAFVSAKNYFDSTLMVLAKTDERYNLVTQYSNILTDIAKNIMIIETQDSLLRISKMSDKDKKAIAYQIKKAQDEQRLADLVNKKRGGRGGTAKGKSDYWAYNDKTKKKGKKDFERRWGKDRVLEDNWRRSNRRKLGGIADQEDSEEAIDRELTEDEIAAILKDVPSSEAQIAKAEKMVEKALFKLGTLYRDRLEKNEKSVVTLEELLRRFPDTKYKLEAWYFLYLGHTDLGNTAKAKEYYDKIIKEFPTSTYARVLEDPNFIAVSQAEEKQLMEFYDSTYDIFENGDFDKAAQRIAQAEQQFGPKNALQPKFALLNAMCIGNLKGKDEYIKALKEVVSKYANTPEQTRAKEILRLLGQNIGGNDKKTKTASKNGGEGKDRFKADAKKLHYFIVVLSGGEIKLTDAKAAVSDFNRQYHKLEKYRISNVYLGSKSGTPILVIRRFKTKGKAMNYYQSIQNNAQDFLPENVQYEIYPITQYNYRVILKSKSLDGYKEFFEENYLE
ncbi:MAG: tetratricopeptide repeat protein [Bacteroidota bacterium]